MFFFLLSLYYFLKDGLVCKEDFVSISGSILMFFFFNYRWLEKVLVCERVLKLWDNICVYVKVVEVGWVNKLKNYNNKEFFSDLYFVVKLCFYMCIVL